MNRLFKKLHVFTFVLILFSSQVNAQRPPRVFPFLAGAELKVRPLNRAEKLSPLTKDTVEVKLIFYRDCEANQGAMYVRPLPVDTLIACVYSTEACSFFTIGLMYNAAQSDANSTPLCPFNPAQTTCDVIGSSFIGYRTEVYIDTVVLPANSSNWVIGLQYSSSPLDNRMNWFTSKYHNGGQQCLSEQLVLNRPSPYYPPPGLGPGENPLIGTGYFSCRINGINTISQQNNPSESFFYIETTYSNKLPDGYFWNAITSLKDIPKYKANTTPNSAANPLIFQCKGKQITYDLGYYDTENHTLEFYKATPYKTCCFGDPSCSGGDRRKSELTFASGFSQDNPLGTSGSTFYNLDVNTGVVDFKLDSATGNVGKYKTAFRIVEKDKDGNAIGEVYRDIVISIIDPPNCKSFNSVANTSSFLPQLTGNFSGCKLAAKRDKVIEACAGSNISFSVRAKSESSLPNASIVISADIHHTILQTGGYVSSMYIPHDWPQFDTAIGTFHWNIPSWVESGIYPIIFQIRDCVDGYILSRTLIYKIRVNKKNKVNWEYLGYNSKLDPSIFKLNPRSGRSFNCCSSMVDYYTASNTEIDAEYTWDIWQNGINTTNNIQGIDNYFSPGPLACGSNYTIRMTTNQYCNNVDSVLIVDKPAISPTISFKSPDQCYGTVGTIEIQGLPASIATTSFYDWQSLGKAEFNSTPTEFSNTVNPLLVKPNNIYNVYVITTDTCIYPLSVNVPLEGISPRAMFRTDKQSVCPRDTIGVTSFVTTSICGQSQFSIPIGPRMLATYDGSESNTAATPKVFTANAAIDRGRTEILYTAEDLRNECFQPGFYNSIAFFIAGIDDPTIYNNIDIFVKCTKRTDLADGIFEDTSKMILLGQYSSYNLVTGWNRFTFNSGFTWDGQTNILFDIKTTCNRACRSNVSNPPSFGDHLTNYISTMGRYGTSAFDLDSSTPSFSIFRHNIQMQYQNLDETAVKYTWNQDPSTLISRINPNISGNAESSPRIVSQVPLTYTVTTTNGKCFTTNAVTADIDTNYRFYLTPKQVFKCPGDTIHVKGEKGFLKVDPIVLQCGPNFQARCNDIFSQFNLRDRNLAIDSCRVRDSLFFPVIGNPNSTQGSVIHSPFGGVNATLGNPTTDKRVQIIYTATELRANPNMRPGYIRELTFDVFNQFPNTNGLQNFTVRMKCIPPTRDSFIGNNFESAATFDEVYFSNSYSTVNGINSIPLQNIFAWDGKVGLMIDICFDNFSGASYNSNRVRASTLNRRRYLYRATNTSTNEEFGCAYAIGTRDLTRPNIGFVICKPTRTPPPIPREVNWAPTTLISNTMIVSPIIYNKFSTLYHTILDYVDTNYGKNQVVCRVRDTIKANVDRPIIKFDPPIVVACEGKSTAVSAGVVGMNQNLYTYTWDTTQYGKIKANFTNPNQVITPPNAGYHYVTVSSVNNPSCYNVDSIYVSIQPQKTMPDIGGASLICLGDSLTLSIPNNIGYKNPKWRLNGIEIESGFTIKVATPGEYSIVVDSGACTNTSDIKTLSLRSTQIATLVNKNMNICEGDSALIMHTQSDNIANPLWNIGLTTPYIKVTQAGKYFLVNPRDQFGCAMIMRDTATVQVIDNPDFKLLDDTICLSNNQKITLQPVPFDPSATYKWFPDGRYKAFMEVYTPGLIKVTRTKGTCTKVAFAMVFNDTSGGIDLGKNQAVCCDEVITLNGNPDGKKYTGYKWSSGESSQMIYTKPNASGLYIVEAIKPNGCKDTGSIFIDSKCGQVKARPEKASIFLGQTNNIIGEHLGVNATNISYRWIPSDPDNAIEKDNKLSPTAKPRDTGDVEYILVMTVMDTNYMPPKPYCIENEVVRFKVVPNKLDSVNVFSPDGDGINDYIYPKIQGIVDLNEFKVYNRFGQLLHDDPKKPWDGKYKSEYQPIGVYIALISYELYEPKKSKATKFERYAITLVR
jgi:hypothetical protein